MSETDTKVTSEKPQKSRTFKPLPFSAVKMKAAQSKGITDPMKAATYFKSYRSVLRGITGNTNGNRYPDVTNKSVFNALMNVAKGKSHVTDADRKVIRQWAGTK